MAEQEEPKQRWWHGLRWTVLVPGLAAALIGLGALVVGLRAAWISNAATPALVLAGVLLVLALIFLSDPDRFGGRWREAEFFYERSRHLETADAFIAFKENLQLALSEGGDDDLRKRITEVAEESGKAAAQEAMEAERQAEERKALFESARSNLVRSVFAGTGQSKLTAYRSALLARALMPRPQATHAVERDQVTLTLTNPPARSMECSVRTSRSVHRASVASLVEGGSVQTKFPANFDPPATLEPGEYAVEWQPIVLTRIGDQFVPTPGVIVARDAFEVPETRQE